MIIKNKEKKETLDKGLEKTKQSFFSKIARSIVGKSKVDSDVLDNLEEILKILTSIIKTAQEKNIQNS